MRAEELVTGMVPVVEHTDSQKEISTTTCTTVYVKGDRWLLASYQKASKLADWTEREAFQQKKENHSSVLTIDTSQC